MLLDDENACNRLAHCKCTIIYQVTAMTGANLFLLEELIFKEKLLIHTEGQISGRFN